MIIPTATEKVAARIPGNSALLKFLKLVNKPLISTSANISGEPVCKDIHEIKKVFDGKIYGALDAPLGGENQPSKIIDLEKMNILDRQNNIASAFENILQKHSFRI